MKPISTFDMKNAQGSAKHRLVFVRVRIKIIRNNRKNHFNVKLKGILILLGGLTFHN
jgi:hypothetical protein